VENKPEKGIKKERKGMNASGKHLKEEERRE
jgi:hypothetical protein